MVIGGEGISTAGIWYGDPWTVTLAIPRNGLYVLLGASHSILTRPLCLCHCLCLCLPSPSPIAPLRLSIPHHRSCSGSQCRYKNKRLSSLPPQPDANTLFTISNQLLGTHPQIPDTNTNTSRLASFRNNYRNRPSFDRLIHTTKTRLLGQSDCSIQAGAPRTSHPGHQKASFQSQTIGANTIASAAAPRGRHWAGYHD